MDRDNKVVIGSYRNPEDVRAAIQRLEREGYSREDMTLYTDKSNFDRLGDTHDVDMRTDETDRTRSDAHEHRSFWEEIKQMFSYNDADEDEAADIAPEDDFLAPYRQDIREGYTVVAVDNYVGDTTGNDRMGVSTDSDITDDSDVVHATDLHDTIHVDDKDDLEDPEKIQLKEERLKVDKEEVQTGEVNVRKETVHDTETIEVPVEREEIAIERKPSSVDRRDVADPDFDEEADSFSIPVKEEKVRVEKEPVVTEEVDIKTEHKEDVQSLTEDIRREELDIDSTGNVRSKDTDLGDDLDFDNPNVDDHDLNDRYLDDRDMEDGFLDDNDLDSRDMDRRDRDNRI